MLKDLSHWFYTAFVSTCCSAILLFFVTPWLSYAVSRRYRKLTKHEQLDFESRVGSSIHAATVSVTSLYLMVFDEQMNDPAFGYSPEALYVLSLSLGYMFGDLLHMSWYHKALWNTTFLVHHFVTIGLECIAIVSEKVLWFALYRLLSEMSTPFLNQRFLLVAIKYDKTSLLYRANGILMTIVFFLVRVASIPIYYYFVYGVYIHGGSAKLGIMWYMLLYACVPLDVLNVVWFRKMFLGVMKVLLGTPEVDTQQHKMH